jgi:hypothetical protein
MFRGLIVSLAAGLLAIVVGAFGNNSGCGGGQEHFESPDSLLLLATPPARQQAPTAGARQQAPTAVPTQAVPAWVRFGKQRSSSAAQQARNRRFVAAINANDAARLDTVVYGDSITAFHQSDPVAWNRHFGAADAHLGMGGSTVPELAWRIMKGGELPRRAPRNVVFLIGINDLRHGGYDPALRLEELVRWYARVFPTTRIFVHALLPTTRADVGPTNARYRQMAARVGATFVDCGSGMGPTDRRLFSDGLHPARAGHDRILACLKRELAN